MNFIRSSHDGVISFTMETEKDNTIPFLDTTVTRDSDCPLTTTVCRKPTHTNQYLAYDLHHLQSVVLLCVYTTEPNTSQRNRQLSQRKRNICHQYLFLMVVLLNLCENSQTTRVTANKERASEFNSTTILPYIKGVSEVLRCCLQHQGIRIVSKSDTTLRSHFVRPQDALDLQNETVSFTRSHVNVAKCTSVKQGDQ